MAIPNGLDPSLDKVRLPGATGGAILTAGTATSNATIKAAVGTPGTNVSVGSIYIGTSTSTPTVWMAAGTDWHPITITGI